MLFKYTSSVISVVSLFTRTKSLFADDTDNADLEKENARLRDQLACKLCYERSADVVFQPCGHLVSCGQCANAISKCAMCRTESIGRVQTRM